ncbi:ATP-binding protein [Roseomonas sp. F4]
MLLLLALTVLLPLMTLAGVATERRAQIWREAQRDTEGTLAVIHRHVQTLLETQELLLDLAEDKIRGLSDAEISAGPSGERLTALVARLDQTVSLVVADAQGRVLASSTPQPPGLDISDMEHFIARRESPLPYVISRPYVGRLSGQLSFALSRRRGPPDGPFIGTIHVAISPMAVREIFRTAMAQLGGAAVLLREDGALLAREPQIEAEWLGPDSPLLRTRNGGLVWGESSLDGAMRLYAWRDVAPFPLRVAYGVDLPARLEMWQRETTWLAALTLLVILVLSGAAWMTWCGASGRARALAELKREAERRHAAEAKLQEARAMEALGRMARGVAHDVNNLLTVVIGNLETLEESVTDPALRGVARRTLGAAEASAQLAASLMAYARTQVLRVEPVDLSTLLNSLLPVLGDLATPAIVLRLEADPGLPACLADPAQLQAAVGNLVSNARDAILHGKGQARLPGRISIAIRRAALAEGERIALSVEDSGGGMPAEVLAHAFDPFFTTKPAGAGSGLGLSQVYGVVTQLGGQVALQSEVGKGTTVTLYLRLATGQTAAAGPVSAPVRPAPPSILSADPSAGAAEAPAGAHILVVDDQPEIRAMITRMLTMAGYRVAAVGGGAEALARLKAGESFDLVLSDVLMPDDLDGLDLAARIGAGWPDLPVLLMSGCAPDVAALGGAEDGFLRKPFARQALLAAVSARVAHPAHRAPSARDPAADRAC